jgi:ribosomal protein L37E
MVCRNICERIPSEKVVFGKSNYSLGQKYCRRCEVYMYNDNMFCPCCGMQLRLTPSDKKHKEMLRKRRLLKIDDGPTFK